MSIHERVMRICKWVTSRYEWVTCLFWGATVEATRYSPYRWGISIYTWDISIHEWVMPICEWVTSRHEWVLFLFPGATVQAARYSLHKRVMSIIWSSHAHMRMGHFHMWMSHVHIWISQVTFCSMCLRVEATWHSLYACMSHVHVWMSHVHVWMSHGTRVESRLMCVIWE